MVVVTQQADVRMYPSRCFMAIFYRIYIDQLFSESNEYCIEIYLLTQSKPHKELMSCSAQKNIKDINISKLKDIVQDFRLDHIEFALRNHPLLQ